MTRDWPVRTARDEAFEPSSRQRLIVSLGWLAGVTAATGALALLGWGLLHPAATPAADVVGHRAPDFTLRPFEGGDVHIADLRGHPLVLNFWASWCAPCRQEEAALKGSAQHWRGRVNFLGVDFRDSPTAARAYQQQAQYPYPVGPVLGSLPAAYQVTAPPTTFFVDAQGTVVARFLGPLDLTATNRYLDLTGA
jgi:cytochrome c biogenesis protein CcmG, thiol:disulfide interchange protein DsbE